MSANDTTVHFLGRCQCGFALRTEEGSAQTVERYRDMETPSVPYRMGAQYYVRCPEGHKPFKLYRVEGEFSEAFECDSRCENAKGHTCKCSCGGMNHGKAYAVTPTDVVHVENPGAAIANYKEIVAREPAAFGGRDVDEEDMDAERRLIEAQREDIRYPKQHIGEIGEQIRFEGKVDHRRLANDTVLYVFLTEIRTPIIGELLGEAKVEWWKPDWVNDPEYVEGEVYKLKAKVKRHDDSPKWGKATVVTYLEEV